MSHVTANQMQLAQQSTLEIGKGQQPSFMLQNRASASPSPLKGKMVKAGYKGAANQMSNHEELYAKQTIEKAQK